ncbi:Ribonuclease P protein subunit rpr2 [Beauveria bassiana]|uniref:Ribonuclease P protein subunit rpr2 n=1 Tax=Beauveria bassiana TaxID=176275 RepID=A0A2N6NNB9_BEABA|nr:Ribonuclease P protein subunit rpr2 [Beauveria bassiana]
MAKAKAPPGVQNKHIYARASYLYQAAAFLATASFPPAPRTNDGAQAANNHGNDALSKDMHQSPSAKDITHPPAENRQRRALQNMSRSLLVDMRAVSAKVLIRQRPGLKRTICRYCDALLVEGQSCDAAIENASRGGRKPWADVLVVRCSACGGAKRFPVGEPRTKQVRKGLRQPAGDKQEQGTVTTSA